MKDEAAPIQTTTVGSYPVPDWLANSPSEQALVDATRVVFDTQRQLGIDLPTDGEMYRFDVNHPETNGMIEYFVQPMAGVRSNLGRSEVERFQALSAMGFRARPAGLVEGKLGEGGLDLLSACRRTADVARGQFKFTCTSPYMLARTLMDEHYGDFETLLTDMADVLAEQVKGLPCDVLQLDEANIPGRPEDGPLAAQAMNRVLGSFEGQRAVHFCFGNYGGQTIQQGGWKPLVDFLNALDVDHLVLELAHRPAEDLEALKHVRPEVGLGIGVIDVKTNPVESAEEVARRIERAEHTLGEGRVRWVHPDCGFWMLKRSVADRKIAALVEGRNLYIGRT